MTSKATNKFSPEIRDRAVRMVLDHERDNPEFCRDVRKVLRHPAELAYPLFEFARLTGSGNAATASPVKNVIKIIERKDLVRHHSILRRKLSHHGSIVRCASPSPQLLKRGCCRAPPPSSRRAAGARHHQRLARASG